MQKFKKYLAELLSCAMILGTLTVPTAAAEYEAPIEEEVVYEETVASETPVEAEAAVEAIDSIGEEALDGAVVDIWGEISEGTSSYETIKNLVCKGATKNASLFVKGVSYNAITGDVNPTLDSTSKKFTAGTYVEYTAKKSGELELTLKFNDKNFYIIDSTGETGIELLGTDSGKKLGTLFVAADRVTGKTKTYDKCSLTYLAQDDAAATKTTESVTSTIKTEAGHKYQIGLTGSKIIAGPAKETVIMDSTVSHNVVFTNDDGSVIKTVSVISGNTVSAGYIPTTPTSKKTPGATFAGWTISGNDVVVDPTDCEINKPTTFVAKYVSAVHTITFTYIESDSTKKTDKAEVTKTVSLPEGNQLKSTDVPTVGDRYKFIAKGWSADGGETFLTNKQVREKNYTSDVDYVYYWEEIPVGDTDDVAVIDDTFVYQFDNILEKGISVTSAYTNRNYLLAEQLKYVANFKANGSATSVFEENKGQLVDPSAEKAIVDGFKYNVNLKARITGDVDYENRATGVMGPYTDTYFEFKTAKKSEVNVYWRAANNKDVYELVLADASKAPADDDFLVGIAASDDFEIQQNSKGEDQSPVGKTTFVVENAGTYHLSTWNKVNKNGARIFRIEVIPDGSKKPGEKEPNEGDDSLSENGISEEAAAVETEKAIVALNLLKKDSKYKTEQPVNVWGAVGDTVSACLTIKKNKVKSITLNYDNKKGVSENKVTLNAKTKLTGFKGYTVAISDVVTVANISEKASKKVDKAVDKAQKKANKTLNRKNVLAIPYLKNVDSYKLVFTEAEGKSGVTVTVVNVRFDKKELKGTKISKEAVVSANNVSENAVPASENECVAMKDNIITLGTMPYKNRFVGGYWMVGKTPITKIGVTTPVNSGKVKLNAVVNKNGTITFALAPENVKKGSIKLTYCLNGKKYKATIKVTK